MPLCNFFKKPGPKVCDDYQLLNTYAEKFKLGAFYKSSVDTIYVWRRTIYVDEMLEQLVWTQIRVLDRNENEFVSLEQKWVEIQPTREMLEKLQGHYE